LVMKYEIYTLDLRIYLMIKLADGGLYAASK